MGRKKKDAEKMQPRSICSKWIRREKEEFSERKTKTEKIAWRHSEPKIDWCSAYGGKPLGKVTENSERVHKRIEERPSQV